jgi:hypothetical protein
MKRLGTTHATAIAYVALFVALGGSGYAATRIATASRSAPVKVRCSASQGRRRVACKVFSGSGVGPRGIQGPRGLQGPSGAPGSTTLTEPPGFTVVGSPNPNIGVNGQGQGANAEWESNNIYSGTTITTPAPVTFRMYLLSPSALDGSATHLASVNFCYGLQDSSLGASHDGNVSITGATVVEYEEPGGTNTGPTPAYSTPAATLLNVPLNITTNSTGDNSCQTVTAATPQTISSTGYLALEITASFTAPTAGTAPYQGWLYFGRVTTTYAP